MSPLEGMSIEMLLALGAVIIVAAMVHGTLGLGFPLIATPLLAVMLDVRSAIVLTLLPTAAVNIVTLWRSGRIVETVRTFWPLVVSGGVGAAFASAYLANQDPEPFRLVLAFTIVVWLVANMFFGDRLGWVRKAPTVAMIGFGFAAGIANGLANVMVAVLLIFVLEMKLDRLATIAVLNTCFVTGKITQIIVLGGAGFVTSQVLITTLPLAVLAVVMLLLGMRFRDRISVDRWRTVLRALLAGLAVILVIQYFS